MNYWLHRISHEAEVSYPLLDKGYLTIGFSDLVDNDIIDKVLANDWSYFDQHFQKKWNEVPRRRHSLWNFLKFQKGDLVVVPGWGTFSVCEIVDDKPLLINQIDVEGLQTWYGEKVTNDGYFLISAKGEAYDLGFARKVKILHKNISRDKFADAVLTARMKIRQTNALINDLKQSIDSSIDNYQKNKPIHLHSIIIDKTANLVLETIKKQLNPDKFEKLVQTYFKTIGASVTSIPAKNESNKDGDADIVAVFENLKLIIYAQAKFQEGEISQWGTNQILDYKTNKESIDDGYNKIAWVITTAEKFNEIAVNLAKENEIQLINGFDFSKMLLNAGIALIENDF